MKTEYSCKQCGKVKTIYLSEQRNGKGVFCSYACMAIHVSKIRNFNGKNNPAWKGGISKSSMGDSRKYRRKNPEKYLAHKAVTNAIQKGIMKRSYQCEDCGLKKKKIHGHHEDYSKPLVVAWLCHSCHRIRHVKNKNKRPEA